MNTPIPLNFSTRAVLSNFGFDASAAAGARLSAQTRREVLVGGVVGAVTATTASSQAATPPTSHQVRHGRVQADGVQVFFREAGAAEAPVILLLHGFANSSFYFRHLMPRLADRFRLIAPDMPSFGFTEIPSERIYRFDFASLSRTIAAFVDAMRLKRYVIYVFDYGAPVGFELALTYPDRVAGIISQNGNAYLDGLGSAAWAPLWAYWKNPTVEGREALRPRMSFDGVRSAYFQGVPDPSCIEPESYTLDAAILARPGNADLQIDLKLDYKRNLDRYPLYQEFLRTQRPKLLAVWGRNDLFFIPPGAEAFRKDVPDARIVLLDTGHFVLETHVDPMASEIRDFF
jgi:pimeloyl-ACP methyl ester carboxylesterase